MGVRRLEYVYGFHGCDKSVAQGVLEKKSVMLSSDNDYDWLGSGIYFWEEAPARAYEWAQWKFKKNAAVIAPRSSSCSPLTFPKSPNTRAAIPDDLATSPFWV